MKKKKVDRHDYDDVNEVEKLILGTTERVKVGKEKLPTKKGKREKGVERMSFDQYNTRFLRKFITPKVLKAILY